MNSRLTQLWHRCLIATDEAAIRIRGAVSGAARTTRTEKPLQIGDLEPRVLFSATPIDLAGMPGGDETAMVVEVDPQHLDDNATEQHSTTQTAPSAREIVIVDGSVDAIDQILDDLAQSRPDADVFVLDSARDGVEQITEILNGRNNVESAHLISHGSDQGVQLGNLWLTDANLDAHAGSIALWSSAFSADADLLVYGCDLASTAQGQGLIESLSALTLTDVAASDDVTGHQSLGGDWILEYGVGQVDSQIAFSASFQQSWFGTLATVPESLYLHTDFVTTSEPPEIVADETAPGVGNDLHEFDGGGANGRKLAKDAGQSGQTDASKYQLWYGNPTGYPQGYLLDGSITFDLHAHKTNGTNGYIEAYLAVTDASGNVLRYIVDETLSTPPAPGQLIGATSFTSYNFDFGVITDEFIAANERLAVKVVNTDSNPANDADVQIAYGVDDLSDTKLNFSVRAPIVVTNTSNDELVAGSLAWAVDAANSDPGKDMIIFAISGGGPHVISMGATPIDTIDDDVIIDGTTDPDTIVLNGSGTPGGSNGLVLNNVSGSTIRGLVINGFDDAGILLQNSDSNVIEGNYLGTSGNGMADGGRMDNGIRLENSNDNLIGGTTVAARNVISGNNLSGVVIETGSSGNAVEGNYIGLAADGVAPLGNFYNGVFIKDSWLNTIGGNTASHRNVISGNEDDGVEIQGNASSGNVVQGNFIGTDFTGTVAVGNEGDGIIIQDAPSNVIGGDALSEGNVIAGSLGIEINSEGVGINVFGDDAFNNDIRGNFIGTDLSGTINLGNAGDGILFTNSGDSSGAIGGANANTVGGVTANIANTIAFNLGSGVSVDTTAGGDNQLLGNKIYDNTILGIDLDDDGVIETQLVGDADNSPVLTGPIVAPANGANITVSGSLNGPVSTIYRVEFFKDSGSGQGNAFLGFVNVNTGASGTVGFTSPTLTGPFANGDAITATATETGSGTTSEFSAPAIIEFKPGLNVTGTPIFTEGGAPIVIAGSVTLSDMDSTDYSGGQLRIDIDDTNGTANDRLAINDEGTGPGQIHVTGPNNVHYNGNPTPFATYSGGSSETDPLVIDLINANATDAAVHRLVENITYQNVAANPSTANRTVEFTLIDGDLHASDVSNVTVQVQSAIEPELWLSTKDTVTSGITWDDDEIVRFGDDAGDQFDLETNATSGDFSKLPGFGATYDIRAMHYVQTNLTLGTTGPTIDLDPGDLILSLDPAPSGTGTVDGLTFSRKDLLLFKPDTAGDYSSGSWSILIDEKVFDDANNYNIHALALVETPTMVGGTLLPRGTFLVAHSNPGLHEDVFTFSIAGVGPQGASQITESLLLLDGDDLEINGKQIQGLHLIQQATDFNAVSLSAGTLLLHVNGSGTVGTTGQTQQGQDAFDVVAVTITQTGVNTIGSADLVLDGSDVGIDQPINAITLVPSQLLASPLNLAPTDIAISNNWVADATDTSGGFSVGTLSTTDVDDVAFAYSIIGGVDRGVFSIGGGGSDELIITDGTLNAASQATYYVYIQATDGANNQWIEQFAITVGANVQPTATNMSQAKSFAVPGPNIALDDIVVTDPDAGAAGTITATLTLDNTAAGSLTDGVNGSVYSSGTGVWTVSGTVADVNAALAAVEFVPAAASDTVIITHIEDGFGTGPADQVIALTTGSLPPTAAVTGAPYSIFEGDSINFDGSASSDPDPGETALLTYDWDIGNDGSFEKTGTGSGVTYTWAELVAAGVDDDGLGYEVALRVNDPNSNSDTVIFTFDVINTPPTITVGGSGSGTEDSPYSITLSATDPGADTITTWQVDWGDGTFDTFDAPLPPTFEHTYQRGGTYNVLVAGTDLDGTWVQNSLYVPGFLNNGEVFVFDPVSGVQTNQFTSADLDAAVHAVFGPNGNLFVTSFGSNRIIEFSPDGLTSSVFASGLNDPTGMAFDANGNLWVAEHGNQRLTQLDPTGSEIWSQNVGFRFTGMEFHSNGTLYLVDYAPSSNGQLFTFDGTNLNPIAGGFTNAEDIAIRHDGNIYVADTGHNLITIFDPSGNFVDSFAVSDPRGLAFGPDGLLYVASYEFAGVSTSNDRILRYEYDGSNWSYKDELASGGGVSNLDGPQYLTFKPEHQVLVAHVADQPAVTNATTAEGSQTISDLVISKNAADGDETTHYKITGITGGTLFHNDGSSVINNGDFITIAAGDLGLKFTPATDSNDLVGPANFIVQASLAGNDSGLGGADTTATITVSEVNDAPELTAGSLTDLVVTEDAPLTSLGLGTLTYGAGGSTDESSQTLTYTITSLPTGLGDIVLADNTTIVTLTTYTLAELQGMQFKTADNVNGGPVVFAYSVADNGTTNGLADPLSIAQSLSISVTAANDPPVLTATSDNPTFIENGTAAGLYSATSIDLIEAGDKVQQLQLTVSNLANGADEFLSIDGQNIALVDGSTLTLTNDYDVTVSVAGSLATISITKLGDIAVAESETLIDGLQYLNINNDPGTSRTVTLTLIRDDGGGTDSTSLSIASSVSIATANDPPTLTATGADPTFVENGAAVGIYSGTSIDLVETADKVKTIELTVSSLLNGSDEIMVIDGQNVTLTSGTTVTANNSYNVNVSVAASTATVTITKVGDIDVAAAATLIDNLQYQNNNNDPGSARSVSITLIEDNAGGTDSSTPNIVSNVTITAANDPPTLTATGSNPTFIENGTAVGLYSAASIDLIEAADKVKTIELTIAALQNGSDEVLVIDGQNIALTNGVTNTTNNSYDVNISVTASVATVTITKTGDIDVAAAESLINTLQYLNNHNDPGSSRTATLTLIEDNGGGTDNFTPNIVSSVTITNDNDAPTLTSTGDDPSFTEGGAAVGLYSGTTIDLIEAADKVKTLIVSVDDWQNNGNEFLNIDTQNVALTNGNSIVTTLSSYNVNVSVVGTLATVTITHGTDISAADAEALLDALQYLNTSDDPGASRTITIATVSDNGGGPTDSANPNVVSNVSITAVNDAPTLIATIIDPTFTEGTAAVNVFSATTIDLVEAADNVKTIAFTVDTIQNAGDEFIWIDGESISLLGGVNITTAANSYLVTVSVSPADVATVTVTKATNFTVTEAETLVDGLQYENTSDDPTGTERFVTMTLIQDDGGTLNTGVDSSDPAPYSTVTLVTVNDPPTLLATGDDPTFTEGGAAVGLFSSTAVDVIESGQDIQLLRITVSGLQDGADEILVVDNQNVSLVSAAPLVTLSNAYNITVSEAAGTATVTITKAAGFSSAQAQTLIDQLKYDNISETPSGTTRTATITRIEDNGGGTNFTSPGVSSNINIADVNDPPALSAANLDPIFTEDAADVTLFAVTVVDLIEPGDLVQTLELTVTGLLDGNDEVLIIDGESIGLFDGNSMVTAANSYAINVTDPSPSSGTKIVTITRAGNVTATAAETLVNDLQYRNSSHDPQTGIRTITISRIQDDGGTMLSGDDDAAPNIASSVSVIPLNDAPTLTTTPDNPTFVEDGSAVSLFSSTMIDLVEAADKVQTIVLTVENIGNGADESLVVDGSNVQLTPGFSTVTGSGYAVNVVIAPASTATITITKAGNFSASDAETLINSLAYENISDDPSGVARQVTITLIQDDGGATGTGDSSTPGTASTVSISSSNDAPLLSALGTNPSFDEGDPAVSLYSSASVDLVEAGDRVRSIVLTVGGIQNDLQEFLVVDGQSINLQAGTSFTAANSYQVDVTVTGIGSREINLTKAGDYSSAAAESLIDGLQYGNTSNDPLNVNRTFTITSIDDGAATSVSIVSTVDVMPINNQPTFNTTATNPTFTENGSAVSLYSGTTVGVVEASNRVQLIQVGVAGLANGPKEVLFVDGSAVSLMIGNSITTSGGYNVSVVDDAGIPTVRISKPGGYSTSDAGSIVDGLRYANLSEAPIGAARTFSITLVRDNGGIANGGKDDVKPFVNSNVTIVATNDAPTMKSHTASVIGGTVLTSPAAVFKSVSNDADGDPLTAAKVTDPTHGTLIVAADGSFVYKPNFGFAGTDSFTWQAWDGISNSNTVTVTIDVLPSVITVIPDPDPDPDPEPDPDSESDPDPEPDPTPTPEPESEPEGDSGSGSKNRPVDILLPVSAEDENDGVFIFDVTSQGVLQVDELGPLGRTQKSLVTIREAVERHSQNHHSFVMDQMDIALMSAPGLMWSQMDATRDELESKIQGDLILLGSTSAAASGFAVGFVAWAMRSGFLITGLLAQLPAWRSIDPLLIMQGFGNSDEEEETLEQIMQRESESLD